MTAGVETMGSPVLKAWEECDKIDTLFIIFCTTICWTIVPTVRLLDSQLDSSVTEMGAANKIAPLFLPGRHRLQRLLMEAQRADICHAGYPDHSNM